MNGTIEELVQRGEILALNLCESTKLLLQPGRLYIFTVDPYCKDCLAHAEKAETPKGYAAAHYPETWNWANKLP